MFTFPKVNNTKQKRRTSMVRIAQTSSKYPSISLISTNQAYLSSIPIPAQNSPTPPPNFLLRNSRFWRSRTDTQQEGQKTPNSSRRILPCHIIPSASALYIINWSCSSRPRFSDNFCAHLRDRPNCRPTDRQFSEERSLEPNRNKNQFATLSIRQSIANFPGAADQKKTFGRKSN